MFPEFIVSYLRCNFFPDNVSVFDYVKKCILVENLLALFVIFS